MENLKVKVNSTEESKEAQELFFELGYAWLNTKKEYQDIGKYNYISSFNYSNRMELGMGCGAVNHKEVTIAQLRDMVVLKRNDPEDANVYQDGDVPCLYDLYLTSDDKLYFFFCGNGWKLSNLNDDEDYRKLLKPIQNNDLPFIDGEENVKEYLDKQGDGSYKLIITHINGCIDRDWIEVPEGANFYCDNHFWKQLNSRKFWNGDNWQDDEKTLCNFSKSFNCRILWQRNPHAESLNDKVASAEVARQGMKADNVNSPSHYNKGGIECIEAIKASMTPEAFCGYLKGNVQKYMWRYEVKGGVESLQKAQWYLNKLIEVKIDNS